MKATKPVVLFVVLCIAALAAFTLMWRSQNADLLVSNVTAAPLQGQPATIGVFLTIHNSGAADRLVSAKSIVAQRARLAFSVADAGLPVPAGSSPVLAEDGAYILMDGVGGDLTQGRMIPVTLFFEKAGEIRTQARLVTPRAAGNAQDFGVFGLGDICRVEDGEPAPEVALSVTPDGDGWRVRVEAEDFTFSQDMTGGPHVPGMGHAHLYLGGLKLQRLYAPDVRIGALPQGQHEVRVTLNTNDHRAYVVGDDPVTATALIDIQAP